MIIGARMIRSLALDSHFRRLSSSSSLSSSSPGLNQGLIRDLEELVDLIMCIIAFSGSPF